MSQEGGGPGETGGEGSQVREGGQDAGHPQPGLAHVAGGRGQVRWEDSLG